MESVIRVELSDRSLKDLQKIRAFNDNRYGVSKSKEIINDIFKRVRDIRKSYY